MILSHFPKCPNFSWFELVHQIRNMIPFQTRVLGDGYMLMRVNRDDCMRLNGYFYSPLTDYTPFERENVTCVQPRWELFYMKLGCRCWFTRLKIVRCDWWRHMWALFRLRKSSSAQLKTRAWSRHESPFANHFTSLIWCISTFKVCQSHLREHLDISVTFLFLLLLFFAIIETWIEHNKTRNLY